MDSDKIINGGIAVALAIVGLAIYAVVFSQKANTANVITSGGTAFASIIKAALGPVS